MIRVIAMLFVVCTVVTVSTAADPEVPNLPITAYHTKGMPKVCEVHHATMKPRAVPFAHGMIPMNRALDEDGEWERRMTHYPHPGDCEPATDIVLPGQEGRVLVFVCPECERAKRRMKKAKPALEGADAPPKTRVEAVVRKFESTVMWDHFDDGRFAAYDGVTLKMLSPAELVGKTIRVYFNSGSVANDSPLRKPGRRCRFDFDPNWLKEDQLFAGALENLQWIKANGAGKGAGLERKLRPIDAEVLAAIELELARLDENARREDGPSQPPPSRQVAHYLLAGLAARGVVLDGLSEPEQRPFNVERRGGSNAELVAVFSDVRVALVDHWIQDKSGDYLLRTAELFVQRDGKWMKKGNGGAIAISELPDD